MCAGNLLVYIYMNIKYSINVFVNAAKLPLQNCPCKPHESQIVDILHDYPCNIKHSMMDTQ